MNSYDFKKSSTSCVNQMNQQLASSGHKAQSVKLAIWDRLLLGSSELRGANEHVKSI